MIVHIFPKSQDIVMTSEEVTAIKNEWAKAYPGERIETWDYEKCYYFVKKKYPDYFDDEMYPDQNLSEYFDPDDTEDIKKTYQEYVTIIARYLVAFNIGGLIVSSHIGPDQLKPNAVVDTEEYVSVIDANPESIHILKETETNEIRVDILYSPRTGISVWKDIIEQIILRINTVDNGSDNGSDNDSDTSYLMAFDSAFSLLKASDAEEIDLTADNTTANTTDNTTEGFADYGLKQQNTAILSIGFLSSVLLLYCKLRLR